MGKTIGISTKYLFFLLTAPCCSDLEFGFCSLVTLFFFQLPHNSDASSHRFVSLVLVLGSLIARLGHLPDINSSLVSSLISYPWLT